MADAFMKAGFNSFDVHTNDKTINYSKFDGLVAWEDSHMGMFLEQEEVGLKNII